MPWPRIISLAGRGSNRSKPVPENKPVNNMVSQVSSYVKTLEHREKREFMQELAVAIVREPQHRSPSQVAQRALEIYQEIEKRIKD